MDADQAHAPSASSIRPVRLWLSLLLSSSGGVLFALAFPKFGLWWAAPIGIGLLMGASIARRFWSGCLVGFVGALAFWLPLTGWLQLYLGPFPWIALATLQAIFSAAATGLAGLSSRRLLRSARWRKLVPVALASVFFLREEITSNWPYGGFSWGRVAFAAAESPWGRSLSWLGAPGVTLVILLGTASVVWIFWRTLTAHKRNRQLTPGPRITWPEFLAPALAVALMALPAYALAVTGSVKIAAVQGAANASLFSNAPEGTVLQSQLTETLRGVPSGVDFVVWPENSVDVDPLNNASSAAAINALAERLGVPLLVGAVNERTGLWYNSSLLVTPGSGISVVYDKVHPVPFAEYVPDRSLWRPLAPQFIDLIPRDYQIGKTPNVINVAGIRVGVSICFDITDDALAAETVAHDAQVLIAQTNNADFGTTEESAQQLEVAKMRALETGRWLVNNSTVGIGAVIRPDGSVANQLPTWVAGTLVADVPLVTGRTPAFWVGPICLWLGLAAGTFFAVAGVLMTAVSRARCRASARVENASASTTGSQNFETFL